MNTKKNTLTIIFALFFVLALPTIGYLTVGAVPALVFLSAFLGGFILWILIPFRAPFASLRLPYLVVFAFFLLHLAEEYIFGFDHALSELTGAAIPSVALPVVVILAPAVWLLGFFLLSRGYEFGYFLAWVFFFAMGVSELAHYVLPILFAHEHYGYFPGMASVVFLAPAAWFGMYRLSKQKTTEMSYRYKYFTASDYNFSTFEGPRAGEMAKDFEATRTDGTKVALSQFFGKWIVLETGSITCPIYESKIEPMNRLAGAFSDVAFLLLYIREAHPGERIEQHDSFADKLACAKRAEEEDGEKRMILVDDLEGKAHRMYGSMPNSVYIINPDGMLVFRGDWNNVKAVERVLRERGEHNIFEKERFSARPYFGKGGWNMFTTLRRAGRRAVYDFIVALPVMVFKHTKKLFVN